MKDIYKYPDGADDKKACALFTSTQDCVPCKSPVITLKVTSPAQLCSGKCATSNFIAGSSFSGKLS
jgi:hypothetical protein